MPQPQNFRRRVFVLLMVPLVVFTVLLIEFGSYYELIAFVFGAVFLSSAPCSRCRDGHHAEHRLLPRSRHRRQHRRQERHSHARPYGTIYGGRPQPEGSPSCDPVPSAFTLSAMTSFAAALGILPSAHGIGSGADLLKPLAIGVIGAL